MDAAVSAATVVVGLALLLSIALFTVEIFVKRHTGSGQIIGLIFSLLAAVGFFIEYSDRLPGGNVGSRRLLLLLPGIDQSSLAYRSSVFALLMLVLTYALRLTIYTRLFVLPAIRLNREYNSKEQVEQRANDYTAPVLAYLTFAIILSSIVGGAYHIPIVIATVLCILLVVVYFISSYLRSLRKLVIWLAVSLRIFMRNVAIYFNTIVVWFIVVIGRLERWRRRQTLDDEQLFRVLRQRLNDAKAKAKERNEKDTELLRELISTAERLV